MAKEPTMTTKEESVGRGSDELLKSLGGKGRLSEKAVSEMVAAAKQDRAQLIQWWLRGQPRPDWIKGTFSVPPDRAGAFIGNLIKQDRMRMKLDVFPYGIPVIDRVHVAFENIGEINQ
ncbi:MAG: hypothetical protein M3Q89_00890 [Verrucomicrobiota bacterium]|nr:hypothetical protein [Verrucomicrobiota bacterium]